MEEHYFLENIVIKQKLQESFNRYLEELKKLIRIPSISFPGFDKAEVSRSAHAVENLLKKIAKKYRKGIWKTSNIIEPWNFRKQKENKK